MDLFCRFLELQISLFTFNPRDFTTWSEHQRYFGPLHRQQKAEGDTWCRTHVRRQFVASSWFELRPPNGRLRRFLWKAQVRLWSPLVKLLRAESKEKKLLLVKWYNFLHVGPVELSKAAPLKIIIFLNQEHSNTELVKME